MDIEEEVYEQMELLGDYPFIPQWEAVADELIAETSDTSSVHIPVKSGFYDDFIEGNI